MLNIYASCIHSSILFNHLCIYIYVYMSDRVRNMFAYGARLVLL